jgi:uncharacterized protein (TIGR02996 family)
MTEQCKQEAEPFLAAIAANPADDLPWLVFADWLEERGHEDRAELCRWIGGPSRWEPTNDVAKLNGRVLRAMLEEVPQHRTAVVNQLVRTFTAPCRTSLT